MDDPRQGHISLSINQSCQDRPDGLGALIHALIEGASDAVIVQDCDSGRIVDVNARAEALYGYSREEFLAFPPGWDLRAPDGRDEDVSLFVQTGRETVPNRPVWHLRKDGQRVPVEASVTRATFGDRSLLLACLRDVSERLSVQQERERLYTETLRYAREIEGLLGAASALHAAESELEVGRVAAEHAAALCNAALSSLVVPHEGRLAVVRIHHNRGWQQVDYQPPPTGCIVTRVIASGHPYRCNDLATDPYSDHAFDAKMGLRTQLSVPVVGAEGRVLGVISVYNKREGSGAFTAHDEALAVALAEQAALALERLHSREELARALETLRNSEEWFRSLVHNGSDVIMVVDADGTIRYASPSLEHVLGWRPEEWIGTNGFSWLHPTNRAVARAAFRRRVADSHAPRTPGDFRFRHKDGSWRIMDAVVTNMLDNPSVRGLVVNMRDVSQRRTLEDELTRRAYFDSLTGLPNRALFMERLAARLADPDSRRGTVVILLDLEGFRMINDSLGHGAGDQVLVMIARRITACLEPQDVLARFGGDEFAVCIMGDCDGQEAWRLIERIRAALREPLALRQRQVFLTFRAGIALTDRDETSADELVRNANIALSQAKVQGKGQVVAFDPAMNARALARLETEFDLRRALDLGQFVLHYQPEVDLATGAITGVEALLRWQHPERGLIAPTEFIPIAEESGLIGEIGRWVLEAACCQARVWRERYPACAELVMGVNLSARQFQQPALVEQVRDILRTTGLPPSSLRLEITETLLMDDTAEVAQTLRRLRELGVGLAIDDFGTGYSSLRYLQRFAVDIVKIDRSFVMVLDQDEAAMAIVRAIIALSHALSIEVTAEGIERAVQVARLRAVGCDRAQGYLFARPLPPESLAVFLAAGTLFAAA